MAKKEKLYEVVGDRQFQRQLKRLDTLVDDLKEFHTDLGELVMREALTRVPVRSGDLRDTVRSSGTKTRATVRAGYKAVPYAGPVHWGWPTRPAPFMGWRGGPIRPNPFLYDALDDRRDEVIRAYEDKIEDLTKFGMVPSTMWEGGRRR
tara:strand:+ start:252 stop:698 length:447 start_codon:yes stop_codon:yes gene_type:complete